MSHKFNLRISIIVIFVLVIFYAIVWIPVFQQYQQEKSNYDHYVQLLKLTNSDPSTENKNTSPNLLVWQLKSQIGELKNANQQIYLQLTDIIRDQKQKARAALDDINFLEGELNLLDNTYKPLNQSDLLARKKSINDASFVEDLPGVLENKNFLEEQVNGIEVAISKQVQVRSQVGQWLNPLWGKSLEDLEKLAADMDSKQAAGQLLMFVAEGNSLSADFQNMLQTEQPGGLIFMGDNIQDPQQIQTFTTGIQKLSPETLPLPLLLATDQEGGPVKRISWDPTSGETSWANKSAQEMCDLAKQRAAILKKAGINTNFSPVVDLANKEAAYINNRTISGDPKIVTTQAESYINCLQALGIFATLKHFPGHGSTTEDSHTQLPIIAKKKSEWLLSDALPFKNLTNTKLLMVGHLLFSDFDKDNAASQSEKIIQIILRREMHYDGVIITDDLKQLLASTKISSKDAMKKAFNSGIDIVLYITTRENEQQAYTELVNMITNKEIPREKVNAALFRILKLKTQISF